MLPNFLYLMCTLPPVNSGFFEMEGLKRICRFCFEKCDTNFKTIEKSTHEILNLLLVTTNLTISDEPAMCISCSEILQNCFVFKKTCLDVRNNTVAFNNDKSNGHAQCEFCMNLLKKSFTILDIEEDIPAKTMLEKYFPELNVSASKKLVVCEACHGPLMNFLNFITKSSIVEQKIKDYCEVEGVNDGHSIKLNSVLQFRSEKAWKENDVSKMEDTIFVKSKNEDLSMIKNPVICASCHGSLEDCFHFSTDRLTVGEKVKKYCETSDTGNQGQIEVDSSLQLAMQDVTTGEVGSNNPDIIKLEEQFCEDMKNSDGGEIDDAGNTVKLEQIFFPEEESGTFMGMNDQEFNNEQQQFTSKNMSAYVGQSNKLGSIKIEEVYYEENDIKYEEENFVQMEDQKLFLNEEIKINLDDDDLSRYEDGIVLPESEVTRPHPLHRIEKFSILDLEKDQLNPYIEHTSAKEHLLVHKDAAAVTMYSCDSCPFQTKHKSDLKRHFLKHKDPSEITMFKCDICAFQAKQNSDLKRHFLKHKDPSEITMFKCDYCSFRTRHRRALTRHVLLHSSEATIYKCELCSFGTEYKYYLRNHLLSHKDPSEVTSHKCDSCSFQTKHKRNLRRHLLLKHGDISEVTMYKCDFCPYQSNYRGSLKSHLLRHKHPSEVTMYKCDYCSFQTKHKFHLPRHLLQHKNPSEVTMHKCDSCLFQTKYKDRFQNHMLNHRDPLEVSKYKCDLCSFKSIYKDRLKSHSLKHKNPSEIAMKKCDSCSFQTKYRGSLQKHLRRHKDPLELPV